MRLFPGIRNWASDTLRAETAVAGDPDFIEGRRQVIAAMPIEERLPTLVAHVALQKASDFAANRLYGPYEQRGFSRLGSGSESIVLNCHDGTVLKVLQQSYVKERSEADRMRIRDELTERQNWLADKIGPVLVPAIFSLDEEPKPGGKPTVLARQRLVQPFAPIAVRNQAQVATLGIAQREQIIDFAQGAFALHQERGMLPDIRGMANLGFEGSQLRLIDTVPVDRRDFGSSYNQNLGDLLRLSEAARQGYLA